MKRKFALCMIALLIVPVLAWAAAVLEVGSSGSDVTRVQKKLIQYGYMTGAADGRYGEKTRDAVRWFQRRNGLTADGRVGPATAAALGVGNSRSSARSAMPTMPPNISLRSAATLTFFSTGFERFTFEPARTVKCPVVLS